MGELEKKINEVLNRIEAIKSKIEVKIGSTFKVGKILKKDKPTKN